MTLRRPIVVRMLPFALALLFILARTPLAGGSADEYATRLVYPIQVVLVGSLLVCLASVIAHAVSNGMPGVWVLSTGNWQFC
jgi:hypothetical protein